VAGGDSDEGDEIIEDFVREDMNNYMGQRENFMDSFGHQVVTKRDKLWMFSSCFTTENLQTKLLKDQ
jgi:hypothetical protein